MNYIHELKETLKDVAPENILNFDESGFADEPGTRTALFRLCCKNPYRTIEFSKKWKDTLTEWRGSLAKKAGNLPKEQLARLPIKCLNTAAPTLQKNLDSAFQTTVICPVDASPILAKLPGATLSQKGKMSRMWLHLYNQQLSLK